MSQETEDPRPIVDTRKAVAAASALLNEARASAVTSRERAETLAHHVLALSAELDRIDPVARSVSRKLMRIAHELTQAESWPDAHPVAVPDLRRRVLELSAELAAMRTRFPADPVDPVERALEGGTAEGADRDM